MNIYAAQIISSIWLSLVSKRCFYELDFCKLMKLEELGVDVRHAIESIHEGEILELYEAFTSDTIRARDVGEALERREDFVLSNGERDERSLLLDAFRLSRKSESVQMLLAKDPDYFVKADRAIFAALLSRIKPLSSTSRRSHRQFQ